MSNGKVYIAGATSNANLTSGGSASIAAPASGGIDAFVSSFTDNGASVSANTTTYIGTSGTDSAGDVTVASDGTVYISGSTNGTFAGAQRTVQNVDNAFATALNSDGTVKWTKQFGGADGVSTGAGIAIDTQGSSVLDALGLPRGTIQLNQSVDLTSETTLRGGRQFQDSDSGNRGAHHHHHHRPGRDLRLAGHQDQRPAWRHRQGGGELQQQRRKPENHRQCRQQHQHGRRVRTISTPCRGWVLRPAS